MQTRMIRLIAVAALAIIAVGCGAPRPVKYYVIDPGPAPPAASAQQLPISLLVARPYTSHLYRDDRLVFGSGPVQLGTYEYERWAQTPADMVQEMLVNYLRGSGQYKGVSRVGSASHGDYIVRSNLLALYEVDQPQLAARFSIRLELFDPKSHSTVWNMPYEHDEPVGDRNVAAIVEAMDRNVKAGMQFLTGELNKYFAEHPLQPPATAGN